jgi:probable F420-dependent oxidoreductase
VDFSAPPSYVGPVRFGLQVGGMPVEALRDLAQLADESGFAYLTVPDHFVLEQPGAGIDPATPVLEAIAVLGALAASTQRARIGGMVLCNLFRHPALTAQAVSTLDHLSGGRAFLGIGAGWTRAEFDMMGLSFPDVKTRLRMLDEALVAIKLLWSEERATLDGEYYRLTDAISMPKPVQRPHPPILLGGNGKGLLRVAARHADVLNLTADVGRAGTIDLAEVACFDEAAFLAKVEFVRAEAAAAGRDPAAITMSSIVFMLTITDTAEAGDAVAAGIAPMFGVEPAAARRVPLALIGTPEQIVEELRRREREWGMTLTILSGSRRDAATIGRFAREILPHV